MHSAGVDVVVPLHNGEEWILEALESALAQTREPFAVIVVDDGSTDRGAHRAQRMPGATVVRNPKPGSAVSARNCGLAFARSRYVAFLDQDDVWHPRHLELLVGLLEENPGAPAASSPPMHFRDGEALRFELSEPGGSASDPWDSFPFSSGHDPSLIVCRRRCFDEFCWPEEHNGMADISVWLRLAMEGPPLRSNSATVARRWHEGSMYAQQRRKDPGALLKVYERVADDRLRDHVAKYPNHPRRMVLERRSRIVGRLSGILSALLAKSVGSLEAEFAALDELLEHEDGAYRLKPFRHLFPIFLMLCAENRPELRSREILTLLLDSCGKRAPIARSIVQPWVLENQPGMRITARHVLQRPYEPSRLAFGAKALVRRIVRVRTGRGASPNGRLDDGRAEVLAEWGREGNADGCFLHVEDLALDSRGRLLVTDSDRSVLQIFSIDGDLLGHFGGFGGRQGLFDEPEGIAVGPDGRIYVADSESGQLHIFDSEYRFLRRVGGRGAEGGHTRHSEFMGFGPNGLLYLADGLNDRIVVYDGEGAFQFAFGRTGNQPGDLRFPQGCKVDRDGRVWVSDLHNHRVQVFSSEGKFLFCFGRKGKQPGEFHSPAGIAVDEAGNVYVCDMENRRVQTFDSQGRFRYQFGRAGRGPGELGRPLGILVDSGFVYIADVENCRIQKRRLPVDA